MDQNGHYNIYEHLKNDFEIYGELLDVGCGENLTNLLDFENSNFDKLTGLDSIDTKSKNETISIETLYQSVLWNNQNWELDLSVVHSYPFCLKSVFIRADLFAFDYKAEHYGLIICTSVLHFYCNEIKNALISTFYNAIKKNGIIFIRLNHSAHPRDTNPELSRKICPNIYQSLSNLGEIRYLADANFIEFYEVV